MSTLLFSAAQLPTPPLLEPSSKGSRRKPRPQPLEKLETLLSLSADSLPSSPSNLATPPPSYDSLYAVDGGYLRVRDTTDNVDDRSDIAEYAAYMYTMDLKEKYADKMLNNKVAEVPEVAVPPLKGPDAMEKIIQAESLLSSLAGMLDHQNDAVSDLKSQLFGIEDVLKELHVQQQNLRQEELNATQSVASVESDDSDSEGSNFTTTPLDGSPPKPYASILSNFYPNPHPSLSSPAVITKAKRSSLTPDPTTRPRRHSVSMEPPSSASPTEEDDPNEDTFERISGILSSLIVEAQEAVEENPHAPRRPRPVSRASLLRPKSRLSLRWDGSDSEQSDDEENSASAKQEDSESEHDAAVAAVTTGLFYEDSDPEDDFLDDEDSELGNLDLEEVRRSMFPVDTEDVAVQAEYVCESPTEESQAVEQARRRLCGDQLSIRSRPSSWGSSVSTSTLVDHTSPAPSPSASLSRRNLHHTKHMSFDLKPNTEFLESMKRIDDSLAEVDFLSKDLVEDLVEDDFEALLKAPPTALPPPRRNPKRQYRSVGTDTSDIAFATLPGQHPSEPFAALSMPFTPTTAAKASYLDPFTPAMRARIITSILFPLLHIPHAFVSESLNGGGAAFHFAAVSDAAVAAGALRFANVLTWTFLFTVGSLMMDSMTGRSVAQIVDVWHRQDVNGHTHDDDGDDLVRTMIRNGFVKQTSRSRMICGAGSAEAHDGKEWRIPGAYYPPQSEYERVSKITELLPEGRQMFDDTDETVRTIPGAYYYYSGSMRKPDEVNLVDVKEERRRLRTDHGRYSLPATLRHQQSAPLRQSLLESLFEKGVGRPAEEGWKRVVVVHDLDGDKTDVVVTDDNGCEGAEDQVLEIVAVKRRKAAAPGRMGSTVVMGRRNSI